MKIATNQIESYLRRLNPAISAYLLFGPDQGMATERARRLMGLVVEDPQDPFLVADLSGDTIRQDPARLIEEAQAISMIGGKRVVRVRQAGDYLTKAMQPLLAIDEIEALVIVEGGDLAASSSLRKLFEKAKNAAAIPCYRDEGRGLIGLINDMTREAGLSLSRDAVDYLAANLGADRELSKREIEKLILLNMHKEGETIDVEEAAQAIGDSAALAIDDWVFAVLLGDGINAQKRRERLLAEGQVPVRLLRAMLGTLKRLIQLQVVKAADIQSAINAARPPIHFRQKPLYERTLRRWQSDQLADFLVLTHSCEEACKTTGSPATLLLAHLAERAVRQDVCTPH